MTFDGPIDVSDNVLWKDRTDPIPPLNKDRVRLRVVVRHPHEEAGCSQPDGVWHCGEVCGQQGIDDMEIGVAIVL